MVEVHLSLGQAGALQMRLDLDASLCFASFVDAAFLDDLRVLSGHRLADMRNQNLLQKYCLMYMAHQNAAG